MQQAPKRFVVTLGGLVLLLAATLLLAADLKNGAEARYLPTRADESDVEVLKELLRGLMAEAQLEQQQESRMNRMQQQLDKAYYHQVERRGGAPELPVASTNGDQTLLRVLGSSNGASTNQAQN